MRRFLEHVFFSALIAALVALLVGVAHGQCPSCGTPATIAPAGGYQWERVSFDPDCWGLRFNGVQVGAWRQSEGKYAPYYRSTDSWGAVCRPPIAPPVPAKVKKAKKKECECCQDCGCGDNCNCGLGKPCSPFCRCLLGEKGKKNFGIVEEKVGGHGERYTLGGQPATRRQIIEALTGGPSSIPDDRSKPSLTFAGGTDAERTAAVNASKQTDLADSCLIQDYAADNALLKPGFAVPSTYLQLPDGKVLARIPSIATIAQLGAVRKAVPSYEPAKDPDPTKPSVLPSLTLEDLEKKLSEVPGWVWVALAVGVYLFFRKQQQSPK